MSQIAWAKFPSRWIHRVEADEDPFHYPLSELMWQSHHGSAIAAIFILMALAIRLNLAGKDLQMRRGDERATDVGVTYDELRKMTGFAKPSISKGLDLLQAMGAIQTIHGHASRYKLLGLENNTDGGWCKLPQAHLLARDGALRIKGWPRNKNSLNAAKIYLLMLHLRSERNNTASASYTALSAWTGVRREEIPVALAILGNMDLVRVSFDRDYRHSKEGGDDQSNRYRVTGLAWTVTMRVDHSAPGAEKTPYDLHL